MKCILYVQAKRQQRKLNFLITQTELYAHFIGKKLTGEADQSDKILQKLEDGPLQREIQPGVVVNLEAPEDYDSEAVKAKVLANVQSAFQKQQTTVSLAYGKATLHFGLTITFGHSIACIRVWPSMVLELQTQQTGLLLRVTSRSHVSSIYRQVTRYYVRIFCIHSRQELQSGHTHAAI